jgi:hypothetical protein
MSWNFTRIPESDDWELVLKASHDYNDSYAVSYLPGGINRAPDIDTTITLKSCEPLNGCFQHIVIHTDRNYVTYVYELAGNKRFPVEGCIKLPPIVHRKLVEFAKTLPYTNDNVLTGDSISYDQAPVNRNHAALVSRELPSNIEHLISQFAAPTGGYQRMKRRTTRKHRY